MKVLLTGGTGFLGKHVMGALLSSVPDIQVIAITRSARTHPDSRVQIHRGDLSDPASFENLPNDVDAVIHLAGLYDFFADDGANYRGNVLSTDNLIKWLDSRGGPEPIPVLHASTYAVGVNDWKARALGEEPLNDRPLRSHFYPYSKYLAEEMIRRSAHPAAIFRLGILVGDSRSGEIEKIDGPYYMLQVLEHLEALGLKHTLPSLPIPTRPDSFLPLVPVDIAAQVFCQAIQDPSKILGKIFGVYDRESTSVSTLIGSLLSHKGFMAKPSFDNLSSRVFKYLAVKSGSMPDHLFAVVHGTPKLENQNFTDCFPDIEIPKFEDWQGIFYRGYEAYCGQGSWSRALWQETKLGGLANIVYQIRKLL